MRPEELSPELQEKVASCQTPDEVLAIAKEAGYTLTDDELDQVANGGGAWNNGTSSHCPKCGSTSHHTILTGTVNHQNVCNKCGCIWG